MASDMPGGDSARRGEETRQRILVAAREEFVDLGLAGARMQRIADRAQVNKAMLHYYFGSKEQLYESVLVETLSQLLGGMVRLVTDESLPVEARLQRFLEEFLAFLAQHPELPRLVILETLTGSDRIPRLFVEAQQRVGALGAVPLLELLRQGSESGVLRPVDPRQTVASAMSLVAFYFVASPVIQAALHIGEEERQLFLADRGQHVVDLFLHGVLAPRS
jgi:TetR/AcrR family transcriptional regulator